VSLFNPQKVIFGGGVFGPAVRFIDRIYAEARKWGQPISMRDVKFCPSALEGDAALLGAAYLCLWEMNK
jgi:glucokinase